MQSIQPRMRTGAWLALVVLAILLAGMAACPSPVLAQGATPTPPADEEPLQAPDQVDVQPQARDDEIRAAFEQYPGSHRLVQQPAGARARRRGVPVRPDRHCRLQEMGRRPGAQHAGRGGGGQPDRGRSALDLGLHPGVEQFSASWAAA